MDVLFPSQQHQEQDKCVDDTAFVYTGENMGLEEGEKRQRWWSGHGEGGVEGKAQTPVSSLPSLL